MIGNYRGRLVLVQCKKYTGTIGVDKIREFEGAISRWENRTKFCIFVSDGKNTKFRRNNGFSPDAINCANNSPHDILLTNYDELFTNFTSYSFKNLTDIEISKRIEENFQQFREDFQQSREEYKEDIRKIREDNQNTIYFLKMIISMLFIIIIFFFLFRS